MEQSSDNVRSVKRHRATPDLRGGPTSIEMLVKVEDALQTITSGSCDALRLCFPTHGDSILSKMNALREKRRFCDITLVLGAPQSTTGRPLRLHGHRVVFAASSDFLRDQFLLHEGRAELSLAVVSSVQVGERLLLSCYTGILEVPLRELLCYLTAASALQMNQVVERCAQAVSRYLSPTPAVLKPDRYSEEEEVQQPDTRLRDQEERDAAQPCTSSQEARAEEGQAVVIKSRVSQGGKEDGAVRERVVLSKLEDDGDFQPGRINKASCHLHHSTDPIRSTLSPPEAVHDHPSSTTRGGCDEREELVQRSQDREEDEMFSLAARLQQCEYLMDSDVFQLSAAHLPSRRCCGDELAEDSDSVLVQRPYLCRRCDRVFQHLESYVGHLKEHRHFLCLLCGKGFSQRSNLTHHIRVHTGVKPFRCPLCHQTFSQKAKLQDHLNVHTGHKPHKCNYCAVHFAQKPGLRRHLKDVHGKSSLQNLLEEEVG
ncbi:zinc finger and BTB domain-containing protein 26-like [Pempheris klunzingeri]|uniref:zinc finger and BTB domain-containing protein 26-like n=1 Tax=Pempheris klunzingeri TaxID=3127111 RepID=UPI00397EEA71